MNCRVNKPSIVKLVLGFGSVVAMLLATSQASAQVQPTIEGVWRVTRHGVNCQSGQQVSSFPAIMTFGRDGIYSGSAVAPGSTPANGSAEYGIWKREPGPQNYSFRFLSYDYDASGVFDGGVEVTGRVQLTASGDGFTYASTIQFFDENGDPLFSVCGKATGTRFE